MRKVISVKPRRIGRVDRGLDSRPNPGCHRRICQVGTQDCLRERRYLVHVQAPAGDLRTLPGERARRRPVVRTLQHFRDQVEV
jgi:hypothetical protein